MNRVEAVKTGIAAALIGLGDTPDAVAAALAGAGAVGVPGEFSPVRSYLSSVLQDQPWADGVHVRGHNGPVVVEIDNEPGIPCEGSEVIHVRTPDPVWGLMENFLDGAYDQLRGNAYDRCGCVAAPVCEWHGDRS